VAAAGALKPKPAAAAGGSVAAAGALKPKPAAAAAGGGGAAAAPKPPKPAVAGAGDAAAPNAPGDAAGVDPAWQRASVGLPHWGIRPPYSDAQGCESERVCISGERSRGRFRDARRFPFTRL
jgi:hypothetical protein